MRFRAQIEGVMTEKIGLEASGTAEPFVFTRSRILFTDKHKNKIFYLSFSRDETMQWKGPFQNESRYSFTKFYDSKDKKRFVIILEASQHNAYLRLNRINRFKCNWLHKRYLVQKDWFEKAFVNALVGFFFSAVGIVIGYYLGSRKEPTSEPPVLRIQTPPDSTKKEVPIPQPGAAPPDSTPGNQPE